MISVSGTTITMTKGDTLRLTVGIKQANGQTYTPAEGDVVSFAAKKHFFDSTAAISKTIPNDTLLGTKSTMYQMYHDIVDIYNA